MKDIGLVLALVLLAGCGDTGTPIAPDRLPERDEIPSEPEPDPPQESTATPGPVGGVKYAECANGGEPCVVGFSFWDVHYVVFPDADGSLEPTSAPIESVPGRYDIVWRPLLDGELLWRIGGGPDGTLYENFSLPFRVGAGTFGSDWEVFDWYFHLTDRSGIYPDVECRFQVYPSGFLVGAVLRNNHTLVCSTKNWADGQNPSEPGLLITFDFCEGDDNSSCLFEPPPHPFP